MIRSPVSWAKRIRPNSTVYKCGDGRGTEAVKAVISKEHTLPWNHRISCRDEFYFCEIIFVID